MSTCISRNGEFGSHELDDDFICARCFVLDEDALIADRDRLRADLDELRALFDLQLRRMGEAVALWRQEDPVVRANVTPDLGALLTWLMEARRAPAGYVVDGKVYRPDDVQIVRQQATPCPTCSGPSRETVGMVCQTCGTDYGPSEDGDEPIDQGARLLFERLGSGGDWETLPEWRKMAFRSAMHILADAGLLRIEPPHAADTHTQAEHDWAVRYYDGSCLHCHVGSTIAEQDAPRVCTACRDGENPCPCAPPGHPDTGTCDCPAYAPQGDSCSE